MVSGIWNAKLNYANINVEIRLRFRVFGENEVRKEGRCAKWRENGRSGDGVKEGRKGRNEGRSELMERGSKEQMGSNNSLHVDGNRRRKI